MKYFWRIFKYVWPQWPRLVVVVATAVLIAILFSVSFMTIMPLLKVMMGEEGLHGWVDRKTCHWRFGMDFYVPDRVAFTQTSDDVAYYLLITDVEDHSPAQATGLERNDKIVAAGTTLSYQDNPKVPSAELLETLGPRLLTFWKANVNAEEFVVLETKIQLATYHKPMKGIKEIVTFPRVQ